MTMTKDRLVPGEKRAKRQVCFSVEGQLFNIFSTPYYIGVKYYLITLGGGQVEPCSSVLPTYR